MQDNPYVTLAATMAASHAPQARAFALGTVTSETPLQIAVGGIEQDASRLSKNSEIKEFKAGEIYLMAATDEAQHWIIICKVVDA